MPAFESAMLELTNFCNMDCDFCINSVMERKKAHMDFDLFKRMIDEIKKNNLVEFITFHNMGEPLLYPQILGATEYALSKDLKLGLCTNGLLLDKTFAEEIKRMDFHKLNLIISFQSVGYKNFERRHAKDITFDQYYEKILDFIRNVGFKCKSNISLRFWMFNNKILKDSSSYNDFESLLARICNDLKIPFDSQQVFFQKLKQVGNIDQLRLIQIHKNLYLELHCKYTWPGLKPDQAQSGYCERALIQSFGILPNGDVTLCCVDYDGKTAIGNVTKQPLMDVLQSDKAKEVINEFSKGNPVFDFCKQCIAQSPKNASNKERYEEMLKEIKEGKKETLYKDILINH